MKKKIGLVLIVVFLVCGSATVFAQGKTTLISMDAALTEAVAELGSHVTGKTEIVIAGIEAPLDTVTNYLSKELGKRLSAGGKFTVLARNSAQAAGQQTLSLMSDASAVNIGKELGAKVVLFGSFSRYADFSQFRLRAIDVRTAQILTLYSARIQPKDALLADVMKPLNNAAPLVIAENVLTRVNRGEDFYYEGKYDDAIKEFDQAIQMNPNFIDAYYFRGNSYSAKGDMTRAIANWEVVLRLNPNHPTAGTYISIVRQIDSQMKARNHFNTGITYFNKKDYDQAIVEFNEAIRLAPNLVQAYSNRGQIYHMKGDLNRAIADYTQAIQIEPNYENALFNRATAYYDKGDFDRAIADLEAVLKINPNNSNARRNLEIVRRQR